MSLSFQDADEILRIIEEFPVAEIRFEHGDIKLYVRREAAERMPKHVQPPHHGDNVAPMREEPAAAAKPQAAPQQPAQRKAPAADREGLTAVVAPMMGVFYAAPAPGAEPFVKVGQRIAQGADLCIIEVMKVMNLIKAPCAGTIAAIEVENATTVEQSQPLIWIRPDRR